MEPSCNSTDCGSPVRVEKSFHPQGWTPMDHWAKTASANAAALAATPAQTNRRRIALRGAAALAFGVGPGPAYSGTTFFWARG